MSQKDSRIENLISVTESSEGAKKIEKFLRLLTWQMFFLIAILLYLALRPQAGRFQFTVVGDDVGVFDTSNSQAWMIKLQKKSVTSGSGEKTETPPPPAGAENQ